MTISKISRFTFALLLCSLSVCLPAGAQNVHAQAPDTTARPAQVRGIQYVPDATYKAVPLFAGLSLSVDLAGAFMATVTAYGQYEAALRANLRGRFFPVVEAGWGLSDHTHETTALHYKTGAPFFRIGCDYNFARDAASGNRILGGLRYGFSSFDYDVSGPDLTDPVWGSSHAYRFEGLSGCNHWAEVCFGLEAKIWRFFHLGWSVRYRLRLSDKKSEIGSPWYVPGYGRNDSHVLSGTFNLVFDI